MLFAYFSEHGGEGYRQQPPEVLREVSRQALTQ